MTAYNNSFEGGSNGTTITTGNSGGTSGDAFDTVTVGTTGTLAFDTTHAAHGTLALKVQQGVTSAASFVEKTFPSASATVAIRLYMYVTANPGVTVDVGKVLSGSTVRARLRLTNTGKLVVSDSANAAVITQAGTVPLNAWFRVEAQFPALSATVGQVTLARFNTADSAVATETATSTALQNFGDTADRVRYGVTTAAATIGPFWLDDVAENDTASAIGPAVTNVSSSGDLTLSGTVTGAAAATATGSLTLGGTATAKAPATATGSLTLSGAAATVVPTVAGSLDLTGTAAAAGSATATGSIILTGTAAWVAPAVVGDITLAGTTTGRAATAGIGHLDLTATTTASGTGRAAGSLDLLGTLVAAAQAQALGTLELLGVATGTGIAILPTPAERIYRVPTEVRTFQVDAETRTCEVATESRVCAVPTESRVDLVPAEPRALEAVR